MVQLCTFSLTARCFDERNISGFCLRFSATHFEAWDMIVMMGKRKVKLVLLNRTHNRTECLGKGRLHSDQTGPVTNADCLRLPPAASPFHKPHHKINPVVHVNYEPW